MSKRVELKCTILNAKKEMLEKTLNNILKQYDGHLNRISENEFSLRCEKLGMFSARVAVKNGKLTVEGYDDYNSAGNIKEAVELFYKATMFEEEFNCPIEMDEEGDLLLTVEV